MTEVKPQYLCCTPGAADGKKIVMFHPWINLAAAEEVLDTLTTRHEDGRLWVGEGPKVAQFEEALCKRFGYEWAVALCNGTAALRLALAMAGVGPGDEVITTAQTCTATNTPILEQFAKPVFADIQYWTGNIDPEDIEPRITEKTKAIIVVHWAGYPCDLDEIHAVAAKYDLPVIEDAAHALGATYHGQSIGAISQYTMFSFQAIKQLTTGDGGLLCIRSQEHYDEARRRRWFGIDRRNRVKRLDGYAFWDQTEVGYKYHMNDISASIGLGNMRDLGDRLARRHQIVQHYRHELVQVPGVALFEQKADRTSGNWLFTMHVDRRDDFCRMMQAAGVEVSVVHVRNDLHGVFGPRRRDLPHLDRYEQTAVSLPLHDYLTDKDVAYVLNHIKGGW